MAVASHWVVASGLPEIREIRRGRSAVASAPAAGADQHQRSQQSEREGRGFGDEGADDLDAADGAPDRCAGIERERGTGNSGEDVVVAFVVVRRSGVGLVASRARYRNLVELGGVLTEAPTGVLGVFSGERRSPNGVARVAPGGAVRSIEVDVDVLGAYKFEVVEGRTGGGIHIQIPLPHAVVAIAHRVAEAPVAQIGGEIESGGAGASVVVQR